MSAPPAAGRGARRPRAAFVEVLGAEHARCDEALRTEVPCFPLPHRLAFIEAARGGSTLFCAGWDGADRCRAGFAVQLSPSRALPGHRLLRVERYAPPPDVEVERATLELLCARARLDPRVLRVAVELHCRDAARRGVTEAALDRLGFRPSPSPRCYERTLALDLAPDEEALMRALHPTARRHVRATARHPVEVRVLEDPALAGRLDVLLEESMRRTGGAAGGLDWPGRLRLGRSHPALSRIVGLFRTDLSGPEALVAFASGCLHGEYAHYDAAGATRTTELKVPLGYALMWDLALWAKRGGARWFDLGGVTQGRLGGGDDALCGISDFKRYFSRDVVGVGAEWVLEPRPARAALAKAIGAAARRLGAR